MRSTEEILRTFQTVSGMTAAIIDTHFRFTHSAMEPVVFCHILHKSPTCLSGCLQSDREAMERVLRTGEPYVYTCPFGLFEAIYPIREQEAIIGLLMIGPALETDGQGKASPAELALREDPTLDADALRAAIKELTRYSTTELQAYRHTLELFIEAIEVNHLLSGDRPTLGQLIKQYVQKNLGHKITLKEIGIHLHCSTVTLTETFRKEYGMSIMQYVLKKRMSLAERLLSEKNATVTEIAERCGFPDVEYFSKCFKETHGVPPSIWREQA